MMRKVYSSAKLWRKHTGTCSLDLV